MFELLEKIRQKPDRTKKHIAFVTALLFSGVIFVVWLSIIWPDWQDSQRRISDVKTNEPSPTSAIGRTFAEGFGAIGDQFSKLKGMISGISMPESSTSIQVPDAIQNTDYDMINSAQN